MTLAYDHFYFVGSRSKGQYLVEIQHYVYGLIIWRKILHAFNNILKIPRTPLDDNGAIGSLSSHLG